MELSYARRKFLPCTALLFLFFFSKAFSEEDKKGTKEQLLPQSYSSVHRAAPNDPFGVISKGQEEDDLRLKEDESEPKLIIIDSGTTDNMGITEFFIYFGAVSLAIVCFIALIGIILGLLDQVQATPSAFPTTYSAAADTYSSYKRAFEVATALENGYNLYENPQNPQGPLLLQSAF